MKMAYKVLKLAALFALFVVHSPLLADAPNVAIIAHPDVSTVTLTKSQLRRIFLMRQQLWSSGSPIRVFVYAQNSPIHQHMCKHMLSLYPYQLERFWNKLAYSGQGDTPEQVNDIDSMLRLVNNTPGAIGYVYASADMQGINQIQVAED